MRWTLLTRELLDPLIRFLGPVEAGCVGFTETLLSNGSLQVPPRTEAAVHVRIERAGDISGAILQTVGGVFYPVTSPVRPQIEREALESIRRRGRRVYSVMGKEDDVTALERALGRAPEQAVDYAHMVQREVARDYPLPRLPERFTMRGATVSDTNHLFDIQRQYEIEEVLLPGSTFDAAATRRHLRETLLRQIVLVAEIDGTPVAKAGTNARGLFYDQIGGVFTEPELRSRGISTKLMTRLLARIAADNKSASLFVKWENEPALRVYRNLGFGVEGGFRISYYR